MKKYKNSALLLVLSLLAMPVSIASSAPRNEQVPLNLAARTSRTHLLTPSTSKVNYSFAIDDAEEVTLIFGSPSKTLKVELVSPSGLRFSSGNTDTPGVNSRVFPDPKDPQSTSANYIFLLSRPQPGTWSYVIEETVPLATSRAVFFSFFSSSPVRTGMLSGGQDHQVGRDIPLALVTIEGKDVLKNLSINATLTNIADPAFTKSSLNFYDDGLNGDATAGDGLFTASIKSEFPGEFQVFANIEGTNSRGRLFQRTASTTFTVNPERAHFVGPFTNRGIDTDGDGLINDVGVSPVVEVLEGGEYNLAVTLTASNGESITSNTIAKLPVVGTANPEVKFSAEDIKNTLKVNGPYTISKAYLERLDLEPSALADEVVDLGSTAAYQIGQLQREALESSGGGSAVGVDTNGNGKFDFLDATIPVNLLSGGYYNWSARLVDKNQNQIALASGGGSLSAGNADVKLRFNGAAIGDNKIDGPYFVKNLVVYGGGKSLSVKDALTTQSFTASQFEGYVSPDQEPPKLSVSVTPNTLWPPNHQMVEIKVNKQVSDNIDRNPTVSLVSITSNEGQNAKGDGNTSTDITIAPDGRVFLRAERSGNGTGRVYTLTYTARDAAGNVAQATAQVGVPRNKGK